MINNLINSFFVFSSFRYVIHIHNSDIIKNKIKKGPLKAEKSINFSTFPLIITRSYSIFDKINKNNKFFSFSFSNITFLCKKDNHFIMFFRSFSFFNSFKVITGEFTSKLGVLSKVNNLKPKLIKRLKINIKEKFSRLVCYIGYLPYIFYPKISNNFESFKTIEEYDVSNDGETFQRISKEIITPYRLVNYYFQNDIKKATIYFNNKAMISFDHISIGYHNFWLFIMNACSNYQSNVQEDLWEMTRYHPLYVKYDKITQTSFEYRKFIYPKYDKLNRPAEHFKVRLNYLNNNWYPYGSFSNFISEFSKDTGHDLFHLTVLRDFADILAYDENTCEISYLSPKEQIEWYNIDLNNFISTPQQLELLIAALQYELDTSGIQKEYYLYPKIVQFIANLKIQLTIMKSTLKDKLIYNLKACFFIVSPILLYKLNLYLNIIFPLTFTLIFSYSIIKFIYNILKPFFINKKYKDGFIVLINKIICIIDKNYLLIIGILFLTNFNLILACIQSFINIFYFNQVFSVTPSSIGGRILPKPKFKAVSDLITGLKLIFNKNNASLDVNQSNKDASLDLNKPLEKEIGGSLLYRSWNTSSYFIKKTYKKAITWQHERLKIIDKNYDRSLQGHFEELAGIQASKVQGVFPPIGRNYKNVILEDLGHKGQIGSESFTGILLSEKLGIELLPCKMCSGHAVEFKAIINGEDIPFEIKSGNTYLKDNIPTHAINQLLQERKNTGIYSIKLVLECSDMNYETYKYYENIILNSNEASNIILVHNADSIILQKIIENQQANLHIVDNTLENIHEDARLSIKDYKILNADGYSQKEIDYKRAYRSLSEVIDQRFYKNPPIWNNGYDTLEEGDLDNLFKDDETLL